MARDMDEGRPTLSVIASRTHSISLISLDAFTEIWGAPARAASGKRPVITPWKSVQFTSISKRMRLVSGQARMSYQCVLMWIGRAVWATQLRQLNHGCVLYYLSCRNMCAGPYLRNYISFSYIINYKPSNHWKQKADDYICELQPRYLA